MLSELEMRNPEEISQKGVKARKREREKGRGTEGGWVGMGKTNCGK